MTDTQSLQRLLREQDVGIRKTDDEITALLAFKADYQTLITKLHDFPKAVSRPAILPFGRKALVPGRLIHTNELLVHLGGSDEYFAELSVHETIELIKRRIERLDASVEKLNEQRRLIHDRVQYTSQFAQQAPHIITQPPSTAKELTTVQECDEVEIRESYDSDTEREWRAKHRSAREKEREALTKMPDPVIKRRVRFVKGTTKANSHQEENNNSDDSAASSTSSSASDNSPPESFIHFQHSSVPSPGVRIEIPDQGNMTVAEAVNQIRTHGTLLISESAEPKPTSAFTEIVERDANTCKGDSELVPMDSQLPVQPARVSRFRAERQRHKCRWETNT
ncbi:unnamed protein product [Echinostoma caproni]|uniref:Unconventional prefoldin RPB5 interactor n=1 Tax=Echinostoma caproni TaxID=27848 RepID=A0A183A043_9TREM|nr:unnamed protein product [Echinostoma caproni]